MAAGNRSSMILAILWMLSISGTHGEYQCPDGWKVFRDECIYVAGGRFSWHQTKGKCEALNASMLTVFDETKNTYLGSPIARDPWLGLYKRNDEDTFSWQIDDQWVLLNFTSWGQGQPDEEQEDCVLMSKYPSRLRGQWNDIGCAYEKQFVCEKRAQTDSCDDGWHEYEGNCYNSSDVAASWLEAREICKQDGADLVVIETPAENSFIAETYVISSDRWIGFTDRKTESEFCWLDQDFNEDTWSNWRAQEPNNLNTGFPDCGYLMKSFSSYRNGRWNVMACSANAAVICEKAAIQDENGNYTCDVDWKQWGSSCYFLDGNLTTWDGGRKQCQQYGADLVVVETYDESQYLAGQMTEVSWIGISDRLGQNIWSWLDNPENSTFTLWRNRRDKSREHDCVLIYSTSHNLGKWANYRCSEHAGFICESSEPVDLVNATWLFFEGHYYNFNTSQTRWQTARDICQSVNNHSDLVVISSEKEQEFIQFHIRGDAIVRGFWTGVNSIARRFHFVALDSNQNVTYTNWGSFEPNYRAQEWCAYLLRSHSRGATWNDRSCEDTASAVCQKPATGSPSYFDFSYGKSLYKIVAGAFHPDLGDEYCRDKYGRNASMVYIETAEERDRISSELSVRFKGRSNFWIKGSAKFNDTADRGRRPQFGRPTVPAERNTCDRLSSRGYGYWSQRRYQYTVNKASCCQTSNLLCEKHIDPDKTAKYDFGFNSGIYKIILDPAPKDKAEEICASIFRGGHVVTIEQRSEMDEIAKELLIRHTGEKLEYWVSGNATQNTEFTSSVLELTSQTDGDCVILQHPSFKEQLETDNLTLVTASCVDARPFVCEQDIFWDFQGTFASWNDIFENFVNGSEPKIGKSIVKEYVGGSCQGPCIGLLVSYPFLIGLAIFATLTGYRYYTRRIPFSFGFSKRSDELYLTS